MVGFLKTVRCLTGLDGPSHRRQVLCRAEVQQEKADTLYENLVPATSMLLPYVQEGKHKNERRESREKKKIRENIAYFRWNLFGTLSFGPALSSISAAVRLPASYSSSLEAFE